VARKGIGENIVLRFASTGEGAGSRIINQIKTMSAGGMSQDAIVARLEKELSPGGATFEAFMKQFQNAAGATVDYATVEEVHEQWDGPDRWEWVCVSDNESCEDCLALDGVVKPWDKWVESGLPGYASRCWWNCRCSLEPVG